MKGLLLAGGHGTRLRPLTYTGNKHMLPVANKPLIQYGLEHLRAAGIKEIGIILGPIKEGVTEFLKDGSPFGVKITYIEQKEPKGLAHAVLVAQSFLGEDPFVMYLGDNLLKQGINPIVREFKKQQYDATILLSRVKNPQRFGVAVLKEGKVVRLIEKPPDPPSDLALVGIYIFKPSIHESIEKLKPSKRGELEITDAIQGLVDRGLTVNPHIVQDWWKDTGRPEDLLEANQLVLTDLQPKLEGKLDPEASIQGNVQVGKETVIKNKSRIRGPVTIGTNCVIGPNVYIGPYTSIGDHVQIQNCEIEYSIIMDDTTINCHERIVNSLIGKHVSINSSKETLPKGKQLILGDRSEITL